jgi:cyclohexanone monooxygenase
MPAPNPHYTDDERAEFHANPDLLEREYARLNREQGVNFADAVIGENLEGYAKIEHLCIKNLAASVRDPDLRRKLTPDYRVGCKRLIISEFFYDAIQRPNAELVTETITGVEAAGVRTADGRLHELDVLVLATGFNTHQFFRPMTVRGAGGVTLEDAWAERNLGYMCVTTPGFPNWFMIGGPNSPIGNFSWLVTAENQLGYAMKLMDRLRAGNARQIAPKIEATRAFNDALAAKMGDTIWASGCRSWYLDAQGRVASWPWTYDTFLKDMSEPILEHFEVS